MSRLQTLLNFRKLNFWDSIIFFYFFFFIYPPMKIFIFQNRPWVLPFFVFAPCQQPVDLWSSSVDFLWTVFHHFFWFLFVHVPWVFSTILPASSLRFRFRVPSLEAISYCFCLSMRICRQATMVQTIHSIFLHSQSVQSVPHPMSDIPPSLVMFRQQEHYFPFTFVCPIFCLSTFLDWPSLFLMFPCSASCIIFIIHALS